jgi:hypothetical protein
MMLTFTVGMPDLKTMVFIVLCAASSAEQLLNLTAPLIPYDWGIRTARNDDPLQLP